MAEISGIRCCFAPTGERNECWFLDRILCQSWVEWSMLTDFIEQRHGKPVRTFVTIFFLMSEITWSTSMYGSWVHVANIGDHNQVVIVIGMAKVELRVALRWASCVLYAAEAFHWFLQVYVQRTLGTLCLLEAYVSWPTMYALIHTWVWFSIGVLPWSTLWNSFVFPLQSPCSHYVSWVGIQRQYDLLLLRSFSTSKFGVRKYFWSLKCLSCQYQKWQIQRVVWAFKSKCQRTYFLSIISKTIYLRLSMYICMASLWILMSLLH